MDLSDSIAEYSEKGIAAVKEREEKLDKMSTADLVNEECRNRGLNRMQTMFVANGVNQLKRTFERLVEKGEDLTAEDVKEGELETRFCFRC